MELIKRNIFEMEHEMFRDSVRKFMQLEHGDSYHLMRDIKELIDPKGLMNPGKIFI